MAATGEPIEAVAYRPEGYDEAFDPSGRPRAGYAELLAWLGDTDLPRLGRRVGAGVDARGIDFRSLEGDESITLDPVPRLIAAEEWSALAAGLEQRTRALNAFIADVYAEREIVAAGRMPARVLETADNLEPGLAGVDQGPAPAPIVGFDVVRGSAGALTVLEDNLRTPSGIAYAVGARAIIDGALAPEAPARLDPRGAVELLGELLGGGEGGTVLVSDGDRNSAWFEHRRLAEELGIPIVSPRELRLRGERLVAELPDGPAEVRLVYRRTDEASLRDEQGRPTWLERMLLPAVAAGHLRVVNGLGAGVGDDKLVHAYVGEMIDFYLGEAQLAPSVRTLDPMRDQDREEALGRLGELVFKPRAGFGGEGVVIGADAEVAERERIAALLRDDPGSLIAQETVSLSTHPTVVGDRLAPRHIDLRAFAIGDRLAPSALTRVALDGSLIVNSSQNGGFKDTWVLR